MALFTERHCYGFHYQDISHYRASLSSSARWTLTTDAEEWMPGHSLYWEDVCMALKTKRVVLLNTYLFNRWINQTPWSLWFCHCSYSARRDSSPELSQLFWRFLFIIIRGGELPMRVGVPWYADGASSFLSIFIKVLGVELRSPGHVAFAHWAILSAQPLHVISSFFLW